MSTPFKMTLPAKARSSDTEASSARKIVPPVKARKSAIPLPTTPKPTPTVKVTTGPPEKGAITTKPQKKTMSKPTAKPTQKATTTKPTVGSTAASKRKATLDESTASKRTKTSKTSDRKHRVHTIRKIEPPVMARKSVTLSTRPPTIATTTTKAPKTTVPPTKPRTKKTTTIPTTRVPTVSLPVLEDIQPSLFNVRPLTTAQAKLRRKLALISWRNAVTVCCTLVLYVFLLLFAIAFGLFVLPIERNDDNTTVAPMSMDLFDISQLNRSGAHLFNTAAKNPIALFWDEVFDILYFVDPTQNRMYWWKEDYSDRNHGPHANITWPDRVQDLDLKSVNTTKFKLMFVYPFRESRKAFLAGMGPIIMRVDFVDTQQVENQAGKTKWVATICKNGQIITAAKPSPFGSIYIACADNPVTTNSIARIYKYYRKRQTLLVDHYYNDERWTFTGSFAHKYITGIAFSTESFVRPFSRWPRVYLVDGENGIVTEWAHNPKTDEIDPRMYTRLRTIGPGKPREVAMDGDQYLWITILEEQQVLKFSTRGKQEWDEYWHKVRGENTFGVVQGLKNQKSLIISTEAPDDIKRSTRERVLGIFYAITGPQRHKYKYGSIYYVKAKELLEDH